MAAETVTPIEGVSTYPLTGSQDFLYIDYTNQSTWRLGEIDNGAITCPNTLFINLDTTSQGRIDLITYAENYT